MRTEIRRMLIVGSVTVLSFGLISSAVFAETSTNVGSVDSYSSHWSMAMWYILSIVLAVIGFMKARSKS